MAETTFHSITLPGQNPARVPLTAVEFSTSTAYKVRDYCTYQGKLYICSTAHAAGAWNAAHFTEVNVGDEESKFGLKLDEVEDFTSSASELSNIRIRGLMTVAPYVENPEDNRILFRSLKLMLDKLKKKAQNNAPCDVLSMGMTNDYEIAIEEGSTMVRVGTAIFGERNYNI